MSKEKVIYELEFALNPIYRSSYTAMLHFINLSLPFNILHMNEGLGDMKERRDESYKKVMRGRQV